jgi:hypothetical protein
LNQFFLLFIGKRQKFDFNSLLDDDQTSIESANDHTSVGSITPFSDYFSKNEKNHDLNGLINEEGEEYESSSRSVTSVRRTYSSDIWGWFISTEDQP